MTFYAISEPQYETSNWYKSILNGLISEIRQKRLNITFFYSLDEVGKCSPADDDAIFVIGTDTNWIESAVIECEKVFDNRVIVLGNCHNPSGDKKYSIVMTDIARHIYILYTYLKNHGKNRIALYGVNPESVPDFLKKESFLSCGGSEDDIFENFSSLEKCYENFRCRMHTYDGIICVNSYAAISLIHHIGESFRNFFITSCSATSLTDIFKPSVTCTRTNYSAFGKAGVTLARTLIKNRNISSLTVRLSGEFFAGETTWFLPYKNIDSSCHSTRQRGNNKFYDDLEISEMISVEKLLDSCTNEDIAILQKLINGKKYAEIAEEHYISENSIKYKLKNMFAVCNVQSKKEFIAILKKYIKTDYN